MRQSINRAAKLVNVNAAESPVAKRSKVGEELVTEKAAASKPKGKRQPKKAKDLGEILGLLKLNWASIR